MKMITQCLFLNRRPYDLDPPKVSRHRWSFRRCKVLFTHEQKDLKYGGQEISATVTEPDLWYQGSSE